MALRYSQDSGKMALSSPGSSWQTALVAAASQASKSGVSSSIGCSQLECNSAAHSSTELKSKEADPSYRSHLGPGVHSQARWQSAS